MLAKPPQHITVAKDKKSLTIEFANRDPHEFTAEILRVLSPSAEVQGHSAAERKLIHGKRDITITDIELVGNYAIRITFADGHNTGIYSWQFLTELAEQYSERYDNYLTALRDKGFSRES